MNVEAVRIGECLTERDRELLSSRVAEIDMRTDEIAQLREFARRILCSAMDRQNAIELGAPRDEKFGCAYL